MFKTNKKLSNESSTLYTEHTEIAGTIEKNEKYREQALAMKSRMGKSAIDSGMYGGSLGLDIAMLDSDTAKSQLDYDNNIAMAAEHLANNPKLYELAAKQAQADGVELNLDAK